MEVRVDFDKPVYGGMSGGKVNYFEFSPVGSVQVDAKGAYRKWGSWVGNFWFHVAMGKSERLEMSYVVRTLKARYGTDGVKYTCVETPAS